MRSDLANLCQTITQTIQKLLQQRLGNGTISLSQSGS